MQQYHASREFQPQQQQQQVGQRIDNQVQMRSNSFEDQMLAFIGENKRLLNIHEQKFAELAAFRENIIVFQANTNSSLKNLETQIGKLALNMKNQSKDSVPSDTRKCMAVLLRSGRELEERRAEKKDTEEGNYAEVGEEFKKHSSKTTKEEKTSKM